MIKIDIPGFRRLEITHLVFDYNGTLAVDGKVIRGVKKRLELLSSQLNIHILTADTFGSCLKELASQNHTIRIIDSENQDIQKAKYVSDLGADKVIATGNGRNDLLMLQQAAIGIMVVQNEGAYAPLFQNADIVCFSVIDALELLLNPLRIVATLRN